MKHNMGLIGFAGSWRSGQVIFDAWKRHANWTVEAFAREFSIEDSEWSLLVIIEERIWEVQGDLSVIEIPVENGSGFHAIGSGAMPALGALAVDHRDDVSLIRALEISSMFHPLVRGPFILGGSAKIGR